MIKFVDVETPYSGENEEQIRRNLFMSGLVLGIV